MAKPSDRSPERTDVLPGIQLCRDFAEGELAVKKKGEKYLLKFDPFMSRDAYKLYLAEAQTTDFTPAFHQSLTGALLRRTPSIDIPDTVDWIINDFGERGQGLLLWLAETLNKHTISSNDWVFIDYPVIEGAIPIDQLIARNIHPYPVNISAENILDTRSQMIDGKEKLVEFRYTTTEPMPGTESYEYQTQERIVRLYIDPEDGLAYRVDYVEEQAVTDPVGFRVGNQLLNYIPVFSWNGQIRPTKPMLLDMALLDKHAYNKNSRLTHYGLLMGTSTITTAGLEKSDREAINGLGGIWHAGNADAKFGSIGLDANVVTGMTTMLDKDAFRAAALGARMFADSGREAESAEALAIKNAASHATLGHLATVFAEVLEDVLRFVILWDSGRELGPEEINVEFSKDFIPSRINGQDLTALLAAYLQGSIPVQVLFHNLETGEMIPDGMTLQEFIDLKEDQMPTPEATDQAAPPIDGAQ